MMEVRRQELGMVDGQEIVFRPGTARSVEACCQVFSTTFKTRVHVAVDLSGFCHSPAGPGVESAYLTPSGLYRHLIAGTEGAC